MNTKVKGLSIAVFAAISVFVLAGCSEPETNIPTSVGDNVINIAAIQGVTAPATGRTPVTAITENAQYRGTVTWNGNPSTFAANTQYIATITLTAKTGHTLQGVTANFFIVAGAIMVSNNANSGVITAIFPPTDAVISIISAIQGVTIPAKGGTPVTAITENAQYGGTVIWSPNHPIFAASTVYTATITLTLKTGYTLQGVTANYFTVDGATSVSNSDNSGVITAVFPSTDATAINIAAIRGVTVPVNGEIPVTRITENEQYNGTVTWSPTVIGTFVAITRYTATINLTPKAGYTLNGVLANFFRVDGATSVSNDANSGSITAEFPSTAPTIIHSVSVSIAAPVKSEIPSTTANTSGSAESGINFSIGTVSWSPVTNLFLGGTVYTASVTLTAHSGYTFTGLTSAVINGQDAAVSNNTGSAITLSHTFPATSIQTVFGIAIKTQPNRLVYTHGDTLNLAGLAVTLTYDDTTTEDVNAANFADKNITTIPVVGDNLIYITHNGHPVEIKYGSLTCNTNNLTVIRATPKADDFNISGIETFIYNGSTRTVTITRKEGKSNGNITVKYNSIPTAPSNAGTYNVTFDVAEAGDFTAVSGLSAGTLKIEKANPTAVDFNINGIGSFYYDGSPKAVTVTPQTGKSDGAITVKYNGSSTAPSAAGTYTVTFDVAASTNFNAASGFSAGTLEVKKATPTIADFNISGTGTFTYDGSPNIVIITSKEGKSNGVINVKYNGSEIAPLAVGTYIVTFDVADTTNYNAVSGLSAGTLTITLYPTFTSIDALQTYLEGRPDNTASTPYIVVLNVNNINFNNDINFNIRIMLSRVSTKYVTIDLSDSTFSSSEFDFSGMKNLTGMTLPNSVTEIKSNAFDSCTSLANITIPDSVTRIRNYAFRGCTSLANITIPDSVTSIEGNAFYGCTSLASITIPNGVTHIGYYAFYGCTSLTSITIPNSITSIENYVFYGCTSLTSVTIPDSVTRIGYRAFGGCTSLTSITIPNSVNNYFDGFGSCTSLSTINVGSDNAYYSSDQGILYNKNRTILIQYPAGKIGSSFTIPNSVTSIFDYAFDGCRNFTSVTIPNSVTSICDYAFNGCTNLTSVTFQGTITSSDFDIYAFGERGTSGYIGDLRDKYLVGGKGTYMRDEYGITHYWLKQ